MAIVTVLLQVAGKLAGDEIKAWLPRLSVWLKTKAVHRLPSELRDRYDEEWQSCLLEIPGDISKVCFAASLLRGAGRINVIAHGPNLPRWAVLRRGVDIGVSLVLIVFFAPCFAIVASCVRLSLRGPAFYSCRWRTPDGREIVGYRFRTLTSVSLSGERMHFRLTKLGQFLRRTSIEELPALFSVVRGDMSLHDLLLRTRSKK